MQNLDNLIHVCEMYKQGKFDIKEFQSRITTSAIPDNLSKKFLQALVDFDNELERIIFCSNSQSYQQEGEFAADNLIDAVIKERGESNNSINL